MSLRDPDDENVIRYQEAFRVGAYDTRPPCACEEPEPMAERPYCARCRHKLRRATPTPSP